MRVKASATRRVAALINVLELALCKSPTRRQLDFAAGNEALEPGIQMRSRTLASPIRTVEIDSRRWIRNAPPASVAAVDAEPASLGPATTMMEHGDRRIIGK